MNFQFKEINKTRYDVIDKEGVIIGRVCFYGCWYFQLSDNMALDYCFYPDALKELTEFVWSLE